MKFGWILAFVVICTVPISPAVLADSGQAGMSNEKPVDPDFASGMKAIEAKRWDEAIAALQRALAKDSKNADILNNLGFAERNRGNVDQAFKYYERALALDPKHRGAHEYMGEAYLMTGNLKKAEEHLAALNDLCFFPCHEYTELKEKVAEYKEKHK